MKKRKHYLIFATLAISCFFAIVFLRFFRLTDENIIWLGIAILTSGWLTLKLVLAYWTVSVPNEPTNQFVSMVLPLYNEDPKVFDKVLRSLEIQTRQPNRVWIVDDGSPDLKCYQAAQVWAAKQASSTGLQVEVHRLDRNRGKRSAQAVAFRSDKEATVFVTWDSDTILEAGSLEELIKPFADPAIQGVAPLVLGNNWSEGLFAKIVDLEFVNTLLIGKASMGRLGSVLVCSGCFSAYRAEICRDHVDDYVGETCLGAPVRNGDDRKLTQFALLRGKVVFQESAVVRSELPVALWPLICQRFRWSTSFHRGSWWMVFNMPPNRLPFWLTVVHLGLFLLEGMVFVFLFVFYSQIEVSLIVFGFYVFLVPYAYIRGVRYLAFDRKEMKTSTQAKIFLLAPLVSLLYLLVLIPVHYLGIVGVRSYSWKTRKIGSDTAGASP